MLCFYPSHYLTCYFEDFVAKYYKKKSKGKDKDKNKEPDDADVTKAVHKRRLDHHDPFTVAPSDPVPEELLQLGRIRRANLNNPQQGAVDKHVIKGSMAKVISGNGYVSLPRILR